MKIYVHHKYLNSLFQKLAHNTTDRVFENKDNETILYCKYKGVDFTFIFREEMSYEDDGYHMLDFFNSLLYGERDKKIGTILRGTAESESIPILKIFNNLLRNVPDDQKWIINFFRAEKILTRYEGFHNERLGEIETELDLMKNHYIMTDNFFINDFSENIYKNHYIPFTNIFYQYNELFGVSWHYKFRNIFKNLNFDYDLSFCVRNYKNHRIKLLNLLSDYNHEKIYLQRTDSLKNDEYHKYLHKIENDTNIHFNSIYGTNDFTNSTLINHNIQLGMDMYFDVLSKAKMLVLDESWAWSKSNFSSNYLSEKTTVTILANIPFISTHSYPLEILSKYLGVENHPFYENTKKNNGNPNGIFEFIKEFMSDFEKNYELCKKWTELVHNKLIDRINNENTFLDILINNFKKENKITKHTLF